MSACAEAPKDLSPLVEKNDVSPSGLKTTWNCVYFGEYPSAEVVDGAWDAVDDYALRDDDLIRDAALYKAKQQSTTSIGVTAPHGCG